MAVSQSLLQIETDLQRQSRRRLNHLLREIHTRIDEAVRHRRTSQQATASLRQLEGDHPEMASANIRHSTGYVLAAVVLVAIYLLDCILFSDTAEYLVRDNAYNWPWLVTVARLVIPAVILVLEIFIAIQRYFAHEEAEESGNRRAYRAWTAGALVLAIVMPALVIARYLASIVADYDPSLAPIFLWQLAGLAILTLFAHATVLFGGKPAHDAKAYVMFKCKQWLLRRRMQRSEAQFDREVSWGSVIFGTYLHALNAHNTNYPNSRIEPGPFNKTTRSIINERFGYEIIQAPNGAVASNSETSVSQPIPTLRPVPPQPAPAQVADGVEPDPPQPAPSEGSEDGENEYLRTILSSRVRDAESVRQPG